MLSPAPCLMLMLMLFDICYFVTYCLFRCRQRASLPDFSCLICRCLLCFAAALMLVIYYATMRRFVCSADAACYPPSAFFNVWCCWLLFHAHTLPVWYAPVALFMRERGAPWYSLCYTRVTRLMFHACLLCATMFFYTMLICARVAYVDGASAQSRRVRRHLICPCAMHWFFCCLSAFIWRHLLSDESAFRLTMPLICACRRSDMLMICFYCHDLMFCLSLCLFIMMLISCYVCLMFVYAALCLCFVFHRHRYFDCSRAADVVRVMFFCLLRDAIFEHWFSAYYTMLLCFRLIISSPYVFDADCSLSMLIRRHMAWFFPRFFALILICVCSLIALMLMSRHAYAIVLRHAARTLPYYFMLARRAMLMVLSMPPALFWFTQMLHARRYVADDARFIDVAMSRHASAMPALFFDDYERFVILCLCCRSIFSSAMAYHITPCRWVFWVREYYYMFLPLARSCRALLLILMIHAWYCFALPCLHELYWCWATRCLFSRFHIYYLILLPVAISFHYVTCCCCLLLLMRRYRDVYASDAHAAKDVVVAYVSFVAALHAYDICYDLLIAADAMRAILLFFRWLRPLSTPMRAARLMRHALWLFHAHAASTIWAPLRLLIWFLMMRLPDARRVSMPICLFWYDIYLLSTIRFRLLDDYAPWRAILTIFTPACAPMPVLHYVIAFTRFYFLLLLLTLFYSARFERMRAYAAIFCLTRLCAPAIIITRDALRYCCCRYSHNVWYVTIYERCWRCSYAYAPMPPEMPSPRRHDAAPPLFYAFAMRHARYRDSSPVGLMFTRLSLSPRYLVRVTPCVRCRRFRHIRCCRLWRYIWCSLCSLTLHAILFFPAVFASAGLIFMPYARLLIWHLFTYLLISCHHCYFMFILIFCHAHVFAFVLFKMSRYFAMRRLFCYWCARDACAMPRYVAIFTRLACRAPFDIDIVCLMFRYAIYAAVLVYAADYYYAAAYAIDAASVLCLYFSPSFQPCCLFFTLMFYTLLFFFFFPIFELCHYFAAVDISFIMIIDDAALIAIAMLFHISMLIRLYLLSYDARYNILICYASIMLLWRYAFAMLILPFFVVFAMPLISPAVCHAIRAIYDKTRLDFQPIYFAFVHDTCHALFHFPPWYDAYYAIAPRSAADDADYAAMLILLLFHIAHAITRLLSRHITYFALVFIFVWCYAARYVLWCHVTLCFHSLW